MEREINLQGGLRGYTWSSLEGELQHGQLSEEDYEGSNFIHFHGTQTVHVRLPKPHHAEASLKRVGELMKQAYTYRVETERRKEEVGQ